MIKRKTQRLPFWIRVGQSPLIFTYSILIIILGTDLAFSKNALDRTPTGQYLPAPFDRLWLAWYAMGGVLIIASYLLADARFEACGLVAVSGALLVDALCLSFQTDILVSWRGQLFYATLYVAYCWRLLLILYLSRLQKNRS
jgi:hypothetical protein